MHRPHFPIIGGIVAIAAALTVIFVYPPVQPNPDPNHVHADFAVWINGQMLDFSDTEYMSNPVAETADEHSFFVDAASAHGDEEEGPTILGREYLHLHDGNGHVIHRHKPDLTIGDFFASIGLLMESDCFTLDEHQYEALDAGWKSDFAIGRELCTTGKFHWTMVVNGTPVTMDPAFVFADGDQILLSYSASDTAWQQEWESLTNEACRYSRTCPWRGLPPAESCIADPTVPCIEP